MKKVDRIVIGSGQAGVPLATEWARRGDQVVLFERAAIGGTCVNTGCTPTKTMVASARAAFAARHAARLGVHVGEVRVDLGRVVDRKEEIVRIWREGSEKKIADAPATLELVRGHARFAGPDRISANGDSFTAEVIVVDVGARAAVPPIEGLDGVPWLDNTRIMELRRLPERLLVIGGGYIGCEFGQMFRRFGSEVVLVQSSPRLLPREDEDVSLALEEVFEEEGIEIRTGSRAVRVEGSEGKISLFLADGERIEGSHLLVATGRRPNTDDLGVEAAGLETDDRGFLVTDERYRTNVSGVYAVGDVAGGPQFTHSAWDDHRILLDLLDGTGTRTRNDRIIPRCVFTDPEVAAVGLSERDATGKGIPHQLVRLDMKSVARAVEIDEPAGFLKALVDPDSKRILGGAIIGTGAGELIHILVALLAAGASARTFVDAEAVHPTLAEGVHTLLSQIE